VPDARDQATAVRDAFAATLTTIRNDTELSDEGKRRRIARAWLDTSDKLRRLRDDHTSADEQRRAALEKRVFGTGGDPGAAVAYRDAVGRAEAVTSEKEATRLLERANRIGDTQLARAVALIASERSYLNVWVDYRDSLGATDARAFTELTELNRRANDRTEKFADDMVFSIRKPQELSLISDQQLTILATSTAT
jgi:hypothetical protein